MKRASCRREGRCCTGLVASAREWQPPASAKWPSSPASGVSQQGGLQPRPGDVLCGHHPLLTISSSLWRLPCSSSPPDSLFRHIPDDLRCLISCQEGGPRDSGEPPGFPPEGHGSRGRCPELTALLVAVGSAWGPFPHGSKACSLPVTLSKRRRLHLPSPVEAHPLWGCVHPRLESVTLSCGDVKWEIGGVHA